MSESSANDAKTEDNEGSRVQVGQECSQLAWSFFWTRVVILSSCFGFHVQIEHTLYWGSAYIQFDELLTFEINQ